MANKKSDTPKPDELAEAVESAADVNADTHEPDEAGPETDDKTKAESAPVDDSGKDDIVSKVSGSASKIAASAAAGSSAAMREISKAAAGYDLKNSYKLSALVCAVATVVWMLWPHFGVLTFWSLGLWWIFVVLGAVLVFAPMLKNFTSMSEDIAGQFVVVGALMMAFSWFFLAREHIPSNASFFATIAAAAGVFAAWKAPGRPKFGSEK